MTVFDKQRSTHKNSKILTNDPALQNQRSNFCKVKAFEYLRLSVIAFVSKPLFFQPPKKVMQRFFWGAQDLIMFQLILIIQKIIKKLLSGYFLAYPPKMHYSAPQCSAMYCSVNASIIHSRWVKYDP